MTGERIAEAQLHRRTSESSVSTQRRYSRAQENLSANAPTGHYHRGGTWQACGYRHPRTGVQIGLEAMCAAVFLNPDPEDGFVYVIAHEFIHVQQQPALVDRVAGGEVTVLEVSLEEGIAEFLGEMISGRVAYGSLRGAVEGRELEIEAAFSKDRHSQDLSDWVYNSRPGQLGDLGYWVGYRIAKSHYQNSEDKSEAIRTMRVIGGMKAPWKTSVCLCGH